MNQSTFRTRRRVGAALLAGVTALGVSTLALGGVADASTPVVSASVTSSPGVQGTGTAQAGGNITLSVSGTPAVGDQIVLTATCPADGGTIGFTHIDTQPGGVDTALAAIGGAGVAITDSQGNTWDAYYGDSGAGCGNNELILAETAGTTANPSITLAGIEYTLSGVEAGSISLSGSYETLGATANTFNVGSDATVDWFTVTSNTPPVSLSASGGSQSVSNLTVDEPSSVTSPFTATDTGSFSLTLTGATWGAAPTLTAIPSAAIGTVTATATSSTVYTFTFTVNDTEATNFVFSGLSVDPTSAGAITAKVEYSGTTGTPTTIVVNSATLASATGSSIRIYGQTPDATVAQEFETAFPSGTKTAVLATDVDPYDALSAAYLEAQLGTGLLITPPTSLGPDATAALRQEGVQTVYVVGGPDAITPAVISTLESTPAYNFGGTTETGSNIKVVGPIYGQTADDTAAAIAEYYGDAYGSVNVSAAYNGSGGVYNDTTGNASTSGPGSSEPTAFVIADTDWQDATTLGPIAYAERLPIILTPAASLGTDASNAITSLGIKQVIVVGGEDALTNSVVTSIEALNSNGVSVLRIAGQDYTDTAAELAKFETSSTTDAGLNWQGEGHTAAYLLSHGDYWSDALGAAAIGGQELTINGTTYDNSPILTTENPTTIGQYLTSYLGSVAPSGASLTVLGGPDAVPSSIVTTVQNDLAS